MTLFATMVALTLTTNDKDETPLVCAVISPKEITMKVLSVVQLAKELCRIDRFNMVETLKQAHD
jgi:hypothetical protein